MLQWKQKFKKNISFPSVTQCAARCDTFEEKKTRTLNKLNANYNVYNFWYCMTNGSVYCLMSYFYDGVKLNDDKKITRSNVFIYM